MSRQVRITGIGVTLPGAHTPEALWQACIQPAQPLAGADDGLVGRLMDPAEIDGELPRRLARKLDVFTSYALIATDRALADAGLESDRMASERVGVFVGNAFGGWQFTDRELRNLHCDGARSVSPFQATAWFPAAPQGQITIRHGFKGHSKTLMSDRTSSLLSIGTAARAVEQGRVDVAIAGGTESLNTPFLKAALRRLSQGRPELTFAIGEGAVFLVLEEADHAQDRGATDYGSIQGFALRSDPTAVDAYSVDPTARIHAMQAVLNGKCPDAVLPDACGLPEVDTAETAALREMVPDLDPVATKSRFGHSFGAEGALDVATAALMLRHQAVPTASGPTDQPVHSVLVNGCGLGGNAASLLITHGGKTHV